MADQTTTCPVSESSDARYQRLILLYTQLLAELDGLHHEGVILKGQIHEAIDHAKMEEILTAIKNNKPIS